MSTPEPTSLAQMTVDPADIALPPTQPVDIAAIMAAQPAGG